MLSNDAIRAAFDAAEDEFGDHKSTEFLVAITADRLGVDPDRVYDALIAEAEFPKEG